MLSTTKGYSYNYTSSHMYNYNGLFMHVGGTISTQVCTALLSPFVIFAICYIMDHQFASHGSSRSYTFVMRLLSTARVHDGSMRTTRARGPSSRSARWWKVRTTED